jgi:hypothetical protein
MSSTSGKTNPSPGSRRDALRFGLGAALFLGALGALAWYRHHPRTATGLAAAGASLALLSIVSPAGALAVRRAWMRFAHVLGFVNTRIILGVVFVVMVTPIALARRLFGRDTFGRRFRPGAASSYWHRRGGEYDPKHFEKPF